MNLRDCLVRHGLVNSRRVCRLPIATQLFFRNLLHTCDGAGRFVADADDLRLALYQHALDRVTRLHVSRWLAECHSAELVRLYTGPDGCGYGEVIKYGQRDRNRRAIHPAREADQLNFAAASEPVPDSTGDPPAILPELNRREKKSPQPPPEAGAGERETLYFSQRLFQTMAELCGYDLARMTAIARRRINSALKDIGSVHPDLLPADLERAAAAYRTIYPTADMTATGIAAHWPKLMGAKRAPVAVRPLVETEPEGWRNFVNEEFPDSAYARGNDKADTPWHDVEAYARRHILEQMRKRGLIPPEEGKAA